MKLQIQVVTWNSAADLPRLLDSIARQSRTPEYILAIDNNSTDNTKRILQSRGIPTIALKTNTGFSYAHNIGIAHSDADCIVCINPDIELFDTAIEDLERAALQHPDAGTISGILLRPPLTPKEKISIVDSAGITRNMFFRFTNIQENAPFRENTILHPRPVAANSGACVLIQKQLVASMSPKKEGRSEVFDEDLFAYKEDVDLGLRIHQAGYTNLVIQKPIGLHARHISSSLSHRKRSTSQIFLSYRNHLLVLIKNLRPIQLFVSGIPIALFELSKFLYHFATHPFTTLRAIGSAALLAPRMLKKRQWNKT